MPRFHRCWYPIALATEVTATQPLGLDLLGTRLVAWRDPSGRAVVQEAWCPHLGADLSLGACLDGAVRCPYHHWRFAAHGGCVEIPTGDPIVAAARIFTYPTAEAWGLVWAFNGEEPDYDIPGIPGTTEAELLTSVESRGARRSPPWLGVSNGVDFQHLRTLHNLKAGEPDALDVGATQIEYRIESETLLQHGRICGTNTFAQHLRRDGTDRYMLFAGTPIDETGSRGFAVVGIPAGSPGAPAQLDGLRNFVRVLAAEDDPILNTINFRRGVLTASDRHLARYFRYLDGFPLGR